MRTSHLRAIPSVEKLLHALGETGLARPIVLEVVRRELGGLRKQKAIPDFPTVLARLRISLEDLRASRIQPVINGTGILIHTNLGRAPLGPEVVERLAAIGLNYSNLEYALGGGSRGGRAAYLERGLALLCAAEAATVVNNNAAALVLVLRYFCGSGGGADQGRSRLGARERPGPKNEVILSRGELIQIGGGFRIPEILESSGARLREVGTTNKTSVSDYARAITRQTALILRVHRSNFFMGGFVRSPETEEIAALAHHKRVPFVEDLGSGSMIETQGIAGLEHEPTPAEVIRRGVDLVCFSGDKLLGGPQAGILAGEAKLIAALKREPFFRALRCDKLILSALEATVEIYLRRSSADSSRLATAGDDGISAEEMRRYAGIPVLEMMRVSNDELRLRAERFVSALDGLPIRATVGTGQAQIGGGTLPRSVIASVTLDLTHRTLKPQEIASRLREHTVPVIGYIARGKLKIDLRTVFARQDEELLRAIRALSS
jgi:L-seryl-tRNA(Ser) seleniumtransferase